MISHFNKTVLDNGVSVISENIEKHVHDDPATQPSVETLQLERLQQLRDVFAETSKQAIRPFDTAALDSFIIHTMDSLHVPGVAACIVKDDQIIWHGEYGYADVVRGIAVTDSTLFMLASIFIHSPLIDT